MRIAISGTHCCGKSTLIDEFLKTHSEFTHEPEAYEALEEDYAASPSAEDFIRQLDYNLDRLNQYQQTDDVIFERCPADYLAYILALVDLKRDPSAQALEQNVTQIVRSAMKKLDLIVFVRPDDAMYELPEEEDLPLRHAVDKHLEAILLDDQLRSFSGDHPVILEATGSTAQRLEAMELCVMVDTERRKDRISQC